MTSRRIIIFAVLFLFVSLGSAGPVESSPRIWYGNEVTKPVPYLGSVQVFDRGDSQWMHICGGAIISDSHILTAARCIDWLEGYPLTFLAGTNNLQEEGHRYQILSYELHPLRLYESTFNFDIAVVKVFPNFNFNNDTIGKISFADESLVPGNVTTIFSGWGRTEYGFVPTLKRGHFRTLNGTGLGKVTNLLFLYAESVDSSIVGRGDAGGPLVNEEQTKLLGILSTRCNSGTTYFTRVSSYVDWIKKVISQS